MINLLEKINFSGRSERSLDSRSPDATGYSSCFLDAWRPYLIFILIALALYGRTLFFDFTYLDDNALILENYPLLSDWRNLGAIFSSDVFLSPDKFYYRPLLNLSFMLDAFWAGPLPTFFHLTNILLHILSAALLFVFLQKFDLKKISAFFLTLFFLVHPALSQAVAWIPGRNDSLLTVFILAAWLAFFSFSRRPRLAAYGAYLLFFCLALLSKESAVALPFLLAYYLLFLSPEKNNRFERWLFVVGSGAIIFFWFLLRRLALGAAGSDYSDMIGGALANSGAWLVYLGKLFWPFNLRLLPTLADSSFVPGIIILVLLAVGFYFSRQADIRRLIFGALWFFVFLFPSLLLSDSFPYFLEHRLYLPLVGLLLVIAELDIFSRLNWSRLRTRIIIFGILILLAGLSFQQSGYFRNRLIFWQTAVSGSPQASLAHRNLGAMYYLDGRQEEAIVHYRAALEINSQEAMVHNNIGLIYLEKGDWEAAEQEFWQELAINPDYDKTLFNLGELYKRRGQEVQAREFWRRTLLANPRHYQAAERLLLDEAENK